MKSTSIILLSLAFSFQLFAQAPVRFSAEQVLQDLQTLRTSLEDAHYDAFAYSSVAALDSAYAHARASVGKDSMNVLETVSLYQQLVSVVRNGHTEIDFPGQSYIEYAYSGGTVFPLELAFEQGKSLVRKNFSEESGIRPGDELLRINGMDISDILSRIYPQFSAERLYFKHAKIEMYSFPRCYWQVFGRQDSFEVEVRTGETLRKYQLKAIEVIRDYEMRRDDVLNAKLQLAFIKGAAYLNPGNFSGDELRYRSFIDSAFTEIHHQEPKALIIDLRNNSGGDNVFSDYLVSYIADRPFTWNSSFSLKSSALLKAHTRKQNDTTDRYSQQILAHKDGERYSYLFEPVPPQPEAKRYAGKVFVLVNRQSHSQAAVTAAQIQDHGFGIIVGEETGDYPTLYASQFQFNLPITGIPVKVSKGYMVRVNGSEKPEGVQPDIMVRDHLLDEQDEILNAVLDKIGVID